MIKEKLQNLRRVARRTKRAMALVSVSFIIAPALWAHPHVFVDGGVNFVFGTDNRLKALKVTWRYDPFETLYILSSHEMSLNDAGGLDEEDRLRLVQLRSNWPDDFDGSAHLSINGQDIPTAWPSDLDAHLVDGRLEMTFYRALEAPIDLTGTFAQVAFYESTYFFAFDLTDPPVLIGQNPNCTTQNIPYDPRSEDPALLQALAKLSREEKPDVKDVGSLFADRITLECG